MSEFAITGEALDERTHVLVLAGEVDVTTAPEFKRRLHGLIDQGNQAIVVDLTAVTFIDSTALGVMIGALRRLRPEGGALALVCADDDIAGIFEVTGLDRVLDVHQSREDAVAAVSPAGA